jgi:DNA processing protein
MNIETSWPHLLSTLWTKTGLLSLSEFVKLSRQPITDPSRLVQFVESESLRRWLIGHPQWWVSGEESLAWMRERGARHTFPLLDDYPRELLELDDPPLFLSYFGSPCWIGSRKLSVVGSRTPAQSSIRWSELHLSALLKKSYVLVSGGARGVDQTAHAVSLRAGLPTAAFLPSGLARIYPSSFESWIGPIIDAGGAVISELGPFEEMRKHYFVKRNRMIAAMSPVTLVVESRRQSGTMITAREAIRYNRTVAVVPGLPDEARWAGSLDLLISGAQGVRDAIDLEVLMGLHQC